MNKTTDGMNGAGGVKPAVSENGSRNCFVHSIGREIVETQDIALLQSDVDRLFLSSKERALQVMGNVTFTFDGWNHDRRELWDIPQVRRYFETMMRTIPLFFLGDDTTIILAHSCCCHAIAHETIRGGNQLEMGISGPSVKEFYYNGYGLMNECFDRYGLDEKLNKQRSWELRDLFLGKRSPAGMSWAFYCGRSL